MAGETDDETRATTDPQSAFMTLSHDLRLEILLALWDAPGFSLSFSELRAAVDERDSGKFSYHLSELQGHFVAETDDGYELQYPGHRVLDAIQSGVLHEQATVGPVELDADCRRCGTTVTFGYDTDFIGRVRCPDCGNRVLEWPFDPGGVADRDAQAVVDAFDRRTRFAWTCALESVCPFCAGRIDRSFRSSDRSVDGIDHMYDREAAFEDQPLFVAVDCQRCSFYSFVPAGVVLLTRPAVIGRLSDAGLDVRASPLWDLGFVVDPDAVSLRETDPMRVTLEAVDLDETPAFRVDDSLSVTAEDDI
jgi:hypothetical protein